MNAYGVRYEEAVGLLQRHIQAIVPGYDRQEAAQDYVRYPVESLGYIRRQLDIEEQENSDAQCVVVKGKKIA